MKHVKLERISLKNHPILSEKWIQERIAEDPSILGLGDLILKDKERRQPRAGRLDLLLQDAETNRRFEVEIQLGATDESHIIRTLEYWDIEKKRYPQYEHIAVIIAEDITHRFQNVISLFNGSVPFVAIQLSVLKNGDGVGLVFTKIIDHRILGSDEEEEEAEVTDRAYWENRGSKKTLALADQLLPLVQKHDPKLEFKYNKFYIGLAKDGLPINFITFRPKKDFLRIAPRLKLTPELSGRLEAAGLDVMEYDTQGGRYRIRLKPGDIGKHQEILEEIISDAWRIESDESRGSD